MLNSKRLETTTWNASPENMYSFAFLTAPQTPPFQYLTLDLNRREILGQTFLLKLLLFLLGDFHHSDNKRLLSFCGQITTPSSYMPISNSGRQRSSTAYSGRSSQYLIASYET